MARFIQRHDPIECGDKVANDIRPIRMWRELKTTKEGREVSWQRQVASTFHIKE
jgi:hypothetical protein